MLEAVRAVAQRPDLEGALESILDSAMRLVGADEGSIQLLDPATMMLSVVAARGLPEAARRQKVAAGQGISGTVAVTGEGLLLPSAVDVDRFGGYTPKDRKIYAALCAPLQGRDGVIGVLSVNSVTPRTTFSERDLGLVTLFAETCALGIENARLLEDTRRHAMELEMLRGATLRLGSSIDLATVAETAVAEAISIARSDAGFIALSSSEGGPLELARYTGITHEALTTVLSAPTFRHLGTAHEVRVIREVAADPLLSPLAPDLGGRSLALVPLRTAEGEPAGLLGVAVDRDSEREIKRLLWTFATQAGLVISNALLHRDVATQEEQLESIVMTLDLPILLVDDEARFRAINPAAALLFRLSPEFELGQSARGKLHPEIEALLLDSDEVTSTEVVVGSGAKEKIFTMRAATVSRGKGVGGRILVLADVSSEREAERRKDDFVAVIGHELRTPLTNIKGFARTLALRWDRLDSDTARSAIDTIVVQSERLQRLIEDLLFVSGVEAQRPALHLTEEDLVQVCTDIVAEMSRRAPSRIVRFDVPPDAITLNTDRVKVEQILMHLLDNALKFSDPATPVRVTVSAHDNVAAVAVTDQGRGIFSGDLHTIFEPFTQIDGSATRDAGGTGVGLYVSSTMAEALGGRIDVESAIGKGSTFTLLLPRNPAPR